MQCIKAKASGLGARMANSVRDGKFQRLKFTAKLNFATKIFKFL